MEDNQLIEMPSGAREALGDLLSDMYLSNVRSGYAPSINHLKMTENVGYGN